MAFSHWKEACRKISAQDDKEHGKLIRTQAVSHYNILGFAALNLKLKFEMNILIWQHMLKM